MFSCTFSKSLQFTSRDRFSPLCTMRISAKSNSGTPGFLVDYYWIGLISCSLYKVANFGWRPYTYSKKFLNNCLPYYRLYLSVLQYLFACSVCTSRPIMLITTNWINENGGHKVRCIGILTVLFPILKNSNGYIHIQKYYTYIKQIHFR